jgi:hypothetical protein
MATAGARIAEIPVVRAAQERLATLTTPLGDRHTMTSSERILLRARKCTSRDDTAVPYAACRIAEGMRSGDQASSTWWGFLVAGMIGQVDGHRCAFVSGVPVHGGDHQLLHLVIPRSLSHLGEIAGFVVFVGSGKAADK